MGKSQIPWPAENLKKLYRSDIGHSTQPTINGQCTNDRIDVFM